MKNRNAGFVLPMVIGILVVLMILIPPLIRWIQQDTNMTVKDQKRTIARNWAEAGLERGQWKIKSTTMSYAAAAAGTVIPGYNFDVTYTDIPGGSYRIKLSSGPLARQVTIVAEGRDSAKREVRGIQEVVQNQTIYAPLMSGGNINWSKGLCLFWGPVLSQGNITLADDAVATWYFPRKYAAGTVLGTAAYPRDINGLAAPNTDGVEWWSAYAGVPDVPLLDFAALRSSAAATGTLNVYGCRSTQGGSGSNGSATKWDTRSSCTSSGAHATHFGNPWCHPKSARNSASSYVWYWDGNVTLSGGSANNQSCGLKGIVIVMGNLTIDTPGEYDYTGHVPTNAWQEHTKFTKTISDSAASKEYPADIGFHKSETTFNFGTETFGLPGMGSSLHTTVGIKGFTYVGGNLTILDYMDFNGAIWVTGSVVASGGTATTSCGVFYDDTLDLPALNVILIRQSWNETLPSSTPWP
jgi:hypothetical protein